MVLTVLDLQKDNIKFSCFGMNDAFKMVPIDKDIVYLNNFKESDNEESDDESDDEESDDKEGCHEESDDKEEDSNDDNPLVTVLDDSTNVDFEVSNEDTYDLDLRISVVVNVIADATFTTGAHILESQDIWIADTGATSHLTKHAEGISKHCQTSVRTRGFAGETIQPDCKMDIPVTYSDKKGTEKFNVILGDVQTNEKFHYNLFIVTKVLLKGYKLEGDKHSLTLCNKKRLIVFDIIVCTQNGVLYCASFTRKLGKSETATPVIEGEEDSLKSAKKILKMNIKWAHDCLGHLSKDVTHKIAA
jgi:hypothetical protein